MAQPVAHMRALRFWRIWFDMASAVAVTVLLNSLLDNVWLAGLIATGIMALLGFVIVGVSPRQLGRVHSAGVVRFSAPPIRWLCWVLGPIPGWLVALGSAVAPGAPADNEAFFSEEEFRELVDRATESDVIEDNEAELIQSVFETLNGLGTEEATPAALTSAVPIKRSVTDDYIVCLEDGKKLEMLKRHLMTAYGMTPEEYRAKWGLKPDYPMVAPAYAAKRQELAKKIGLGRKPRTPEPAPVPAKTRGRKKAAA